MFLTFTIPKKMNMVTREIKRKPRSHAEVKEMTGLDVSIRVMHSYLNVGGVKYDYREKVWRARIEPDVYLWARRADDEVIRRVGG